MVNKIVSKPSLDTEPTQVGGVLEIAPDIHDPGAPNSQVHAASTPAVWADGPYLKFGGKSLVRCQCACGTCHDTVSAGLANGFEFVDPIGKADCAHPLKFPACLHAEPAGNALVGIALHKGV